MNKLNFFVKRCFRELLSSLDDIGINPNNIKIEFSRNNSKLFIYLSYNLGYLELSVTIKKQNNNFMLSCKLCKDGYSYYKYSDLKRKYKFSSLNTLKDDLKDYILAQKKVILSIIDRFLFVPPKSFVEKLSIKVKKFLANLLKKGIDSKLIYEYGYDSYFSLYQISLGINKRYSLRFNLSINRYENNIFISSYLSSLDACYFEDTISEIKVISDNLDEFENYINELEPLVLKYIKQVESHKNQAIMNIIDFIDKKVNSFILNSKNKLTVSREEIIYYEERNNLTFIFSKESIKDKTFDPILEIKIFPNLKTITFYIESYYFNLIESKYENLLKNNYASELKLENETNFIKEFVPKLDLLLDRIDFLTNIPEIDISIPKTFSEFITNAEIELYKKIQTIDESIRFESFGNTLFYKTFHNSLELSFSFKKIDRVIKIKMKLLVLYFHKEISLVEKDFEFNYDKDDIELILNSIYSEIISLDKLIVKEVYNIRNEPFLL